jgi:hypothetical protein
MNKIFLCHMRKRLFNPLLLIAFLMPCFSQAQVSSQELFFKGDTLQGYDLQAAYESALKYNSVHHLSPDELRMYRYDQQQQFVVQKYKITLFYEKGADVQRLLSGSCSNLDFGAGDFTGWTGAVGYDSTNTAPLSMFSNGAGIHTLGLNSIDSSCSFHTLVNASAGVDRFGGFPKLAPGGSGYSVQLGSFYQNKASGPTGFNACAFNASGTNSHSDGEILQQSFLVAASNALISYQYAVVLDSAAHRQADAPYFRAEVLDSNGKSIPCLTRFLSTDSLLKNGFSKSAVVDRFVPVYFLPWRKASFNLTPYVGTTVTLRFTAAGCAVGGHAGYAYVSASCSALKLRGSTGNCLSTTDTLYAPPGAAAYQWATVPAGGPGISGPSNMPSVAITQNGHYQVALSYYSGCSYVIDTTLNLSSHPAPSVQITTNTVPCSTCSNGSVSAIVSGGSPAYTYSWSTNPPQLTDTATGLPQGTYTVTVTDANGCAGSNTVVLNTPLGIVSQTKDLDWSLYPNPVSDMLMLEMNVNKPQHVLIAVSDVLGQLVYTSCADIPLTYRQAISFQGIPSGIYFVVLQSSNGRYCRKIIRQ